MDYKKKMTMKRRIYMAVSALVMICLLAACGGKAESAGGKTAADQGKAADRPVRIGVLQIADSFPLYVAEEEGLFEENGLDVEIVEFQSASDQSVAYEAGELDGMMTDMIVQSLVNKSSEDGMKTVAMAFGGDASEGRFIVASSPDSEIKEPAQLAGARIGISENTMMEYLPGPYTFILDKRSIVPRIITSGTSYVGVRVPGNGLARRLAGIFPITTTSANISDDEVLTNPSDILDQLDCDVDLVIDVGDLGPAKSSTIVDLTSFKPKIIRK